MQEVGGVSDTCARHIKCKDIVDHSTDPLTNQALYDTKIIIKIDYSTTSSSSLSLLLR